MENKIVFILKKSQIKGNIFEVILYINRESDF